MGASVIITGLSSEIAQTLVTIGVDLSKMNAVGDLQGLAGILLFAFVMVIHGRWMMSSLDEMHHDFGGWLLLFFTWGGLHFWPLFFLRWLGVSRESESCRNATSVRIPSR